MCCLMVNLQQFTKDEITEKAKASFSFFEVYLKKKNPGRSQVQIFWPFFSCLLKLSWQRLPLSVLGTVPWPGHVWFEDFLPFLFAKPLKLSQAGFSGLSREVYSRSILDSNEMSRPFLEKLYQRFIVVRENRVLSTFTECQMVSWFQNFLHIQYEVVND